MPQFPSTNPRPMCYRCYRAAAVCICNRLPSVANKTGVFVLQHPKESRHPVGSARIVRLGLKRVQLTVAQGQKALYCPLDLPPHTGLLYPAAQPHDLAQLDKTQYPHNVLILDGTWAQARCLYRANPWLQALPHYALNPTTPSRYRIRRQPTTTCLSTVEALVQALTILEPETPGLDALLHTFDEMVQEQIDFEEQNAKT